MTNEYSHCRPEETHKGDQAHQAWNKADTQSMLQSLQTAKKSILVPMKTFHLNQVLELTQNKENRKTG
jgi:hypothetical protein